MWPALHRLTLVIIKPTGCTNFSNLFLEWNSTCFGEFPCPSSGVFHCTHSNGVCHTPDMLTACEQDLSLTCTYCCVYSENSWWWIEELSETCRVSFKNKFQKLVHLVHFIIRNKTQLCVLKFNGGIYNYHFKGLIYQTRNQQFGCSQHTYSPPR